MPGCHSCGETVDDDSLICPHCFGNVVPPASKTPEVKTPSPEVETAVVLNDDDDMLDDEITLAPLEVDARDQSDTRPDAAIGVSKPKRLNKEAEKEGRCPNCQGLRGSSTDLCTKCGYHFGLQRVLTKEDEQDEQDIGLRRIIRRSLTDDTGLLSVSILAHVVFVVIGGIFYVQAPILRWFLVLLFCGYVIYRVTDIFAGRRYMRALEHFIWVMILRLIRLVGWRDPRRPNKRLNVLHATNFSDEEMKTAEPTLSEFDAIDLSGSAISDAALPALFGKPNLRYIVLLDTNLSDESINHLQRNHGNAWIWR